MRKQTGALEAALSKNPNQSPMAPELPAQGGKQNGFSREESIPAEFYDVVEEIKQLVLTGKLPADFDLRQACTDPAFAALVAAFPAEAAVRVYCAENRAADAEQSAMRRVNQQVSDRRALPRSARGGVMSAPAPNYRDMDDATFRKLLAQMKKSARNGVSTRL